MKDLKRQDKNGVRTAVDLERRYKLQEIDPTIEEVEELKKARVVDDYLSTTSVNPVQNRVITSALNNKVTRETGKGLSTNDLTDELKAQYDSATTEQHTHNNKSILDDITAAYTTSEKTKLSLIESNAQENIIESISVDGVPQQIVNKNVNITGGGGGGISVVDNLNSTSSTDALSAKQGKVLNDKIKSLPIYIGSQQIATGPFNGDALGSDVTLLGAYRYQLIDGLFNNIEIPEGYHAEYRLSFQGQTGNCYVKVGLNNIWTEEIMTWSNSTMRHIKSTDFFKNEDIILEPTYGYSNDGVNLKIRGTGNYPTTWSVWNITIHCYLVAD